MVVDDDYELIPKHELDNLKREVEKLKKNPLGDLPEGETLVDEVKSLNTNIKKLIDLFANTEADLAKEYAETNPVTEMRAMKEQNEQIAQGILALADMIKQMQEDIISKRAEMPMSQNTIGNGALDKYGLPMSPPPVDNFSLPDMGPMGLPQQPPPITEKKKGLFGR